MCTDSHGSPPVIVQMIPRMIKVASLPDIPAVVNNLPEAWAFCHAILPDVSRTFALNIPVLPPRLRDSVCCAYLLCRIADTIEDTETLPAPTRRALYDALNRAVDPARPQPTDLPGFAQHAASAAEAYARLIAGAPLVLSAFASLPPASRAAIAECVREMIAGMRSPTARGREAGIRFIAADFADLDTYCHFVAGTVGVMLTRLFSSELGEPPGLATARTRELGRRFGLGLQATNIIKDHADDVARGVCFVPRTSVGPAADRCPITQPQRDVLIRHAVDHLDRAMEFVLLIPHQADGIRLFCLWALMLALGTLREAAKAESPTPKVARSEVAKILSDSRRFVADDTRLLAWFGDYRNQVAAALSAAANGATHA